MTKPAHKQDLRKTLTKLDAAYASEEMREVTRPPRALDMHLQVRGRGLGARSPKKVCRDL